MRSTKRVWLGLCAVLVIGGCSTAPTTSTQAERDRPAPQAAPDSALQQSYDAALKSLREGDLTRAKVQFEQLAEANPDLSGPLTNLGIIELKQNDPGAAEQAFRNALARNPDSAPAHNQLGVALRMQGRFQEAEQAYQTALKLEPVYLLAHRNLGILYDLYLARPEKALEQYRLCQQLAEAPDQEIEGWILDLERRVGSAR